MLRKTIQVWLFYEMTFGHQDTCQENKKDQEEYVMNESETHCVLIFSTSTRGAQIQLLGKIGMATRVKLSWAEGEITVKIHFMFVHE